MLELACFFILFHWLPESYVWMSSFKVHYLRKLFFYGTIILKCSINALIISTKMCHRFGVNTEDRQKRRYIRTVSLNFTTYSKSRLLIYETEFNFLSLEHLEPELWQIYLHASYVQCAPMAWKDLKLRKIATSWPIMFPWSCKLWISNVATAYTISTSNGEFFSHSSKLG